MTAPKEKKSTHFYCFECRVPHPMSQLAIDEVRNNHHYRRCKKHTENRVNGDTETVAKVLNGMKEDKAAKTERGICACGNIEELIDGRCTECHEAWEDKKNIIFVGTESGRPRLQSTEDRYLHMVEFGENSEKNLALR